MLPYYEKEARERQKGGQGGVLLTESFPEASGEARNKLGETIGVSGRYISEAKKRKQGVLISVF